MEIYLLFFENMPPDTFWSISNKFPDLVKHLHQQVRVISNYGLNCGVPGFTEPIVQFASFVRTKLKTVHIFSCAVKLLRLISVPSDKILIQRFCYRILLMAFLLGGLPLPFEV